jgi:hypothetical protein
MYADARNQIRPALRTERERASLADAMDRTRELARMAQMPRLTAMGTERRTQPPMANRKAIPEGSVATIRPGQGTVRIVALPQTSSRLDVKLFPEDRDSLRERTDTDAVGAFHNARLATDVLGEVEDGRLSLA